MTPLATIDQNEWGCAAAVARAAGISRYRLLGAGAAGLVRTRVSRGRTLFHRGDAMAVFPDAMPVAGSAA